MSQKNYQLENLENGARILSLPIENSKTAAFFVLINTGSRYETKEQNGLSHFIEHMFFKGTNKRPDFLKISKAFDGLGGEHNAFTSKEFTGYWVKVTSENLKNGIEIISDMLLNSKFDAKEIEKEKGVILEEVNMIQDNPMRHIWEVFEDCLYGDTQIGRSTIGTKENIKNFSRQNFIDYLDSQYSADRALICLAGQFNEEHLSLVKNLFKDWQKKQFKLSEKIIENQNNPKVKIFQKKTDQTHISLGVRAYHMGHKNEPIAEILASILGGSMSSRLFENLRERNGLVYYVRAINQNYTDHGFLTANAGVPIDKAKEAISIILEEYKRLKEELVLEEELNLIKNLIKGRLILDLETVDEVAQWYGDHFLLTNNILTPEEFFQKIYQVSAQDLQKVAQEIFQTKNLNLAVIGDYKNEEEFKELLNI